MSKEQKISIPVTGPAHSVFPSKKTYAIMGEENIFAMLADFYVELEASEIRGMFPKDMARASRKSAAFFIWLMGGPPMYQERYGPPMMRARHLPFVIDEAARQVWLTCFEQVLVEAPTTYNFPAEHLPQFREFLVSFSGRMVNTA